MKPVMLAAAIRSADGRQSGSVIRPSHAGRPLLRGRLLCAYCYRPEAGPDATACHPSHGTPPMSFADPIIAAVRRLPLSIQVGLLSVGAMLLFAIANGFIRHISQSVPAVEVAFFRALFGVLFLAPILLRTGMAGLRTQRHGLFLLRGALVAVQSGMWMYSLYLLPIDKATALNFTVPLWATIGAALILGETVRARRWTAVTVGILGSLIILRPGFTAFEPASLVPLAAAVGMAFSMLIVKTLSRTEATHTIVLYMGIYSTPFLLIGALPVWQTPDAPTLGLLFVMSAIGASGQLLITRAFALAEASAVVPYDFFRLPFGAVVGWFWFGELMDGWSWVGAAVIFAAGAYIAHREAQVARARAGRAP
jgi:drug/metabolite transporter (DMT)-like permease